MKVSSAVLVSLGCGRQKLATLIVSRVVSARCSSANNCRLKTNRPLNFIVVFSLPRLYYTDRFGTNLLIAEETLVRNVKSNQKVRWMFCGKCVRKSRNTSRFQFTAHAKIYERAFFSRQVGLETRNAKRRNRRGCAVWRHSALTFKLQFLSEIMKRLDYWAFVVVKRLSNRERFDLLKKYWKRRR